MAPSKRCRQGNQPKPKRLKGSDVSDATAQRCATVAQVISKAEQIPEACRAMLISAVPLALGVLPGDRDKRQVALSSFIGEVLKDLEVSLLERLLQEKHAAKEQVLLAARQSQKTASTVSHRLKEVERAEEQLAMPLCGRGGQDRERCHAKVSCRGRGGPQHG